ncbi:MAG: glycoside hydrolase domain-containing protein [Candidatus Zipacnadales bacterium]
MILLAIITLPLGVAADLPRLVATPIKDPPRIDGRLTEPVWSSAFNAQPFLLLGSAKPPTQPTVAYVLYDAEALYFGFECIEDRREAIVTVIQERDGPVYLDDCVEVFIAAGPDPKHYRHFVVNAAGVLRDEQGQDASWNSSVCAAARRTPDGWSAELLVPLSALDIPPNAGTKWRLNLCRGERPHEELSSWAPTQQSFHEPDRFGWLTDIKINVARYARANIVQDLRHAWRELQPGLKRAREALPLQAAQTTMTAAEAARDALLKARKLAAPPTATVDDLLQAANLYQEGLNALHTLRTALPHLEMSVALRRQNAPTEYAVCEESSMARVRPDQPYAGRPAQQFSLALARNEYEATQLVVAPIEQALRAVRVSVSDLQGPSGAIQADQIVVNRIGYVNVSQPSARSGAQPGLYPDPLVPNEAVDIPLHSTAAWLITLYAKPDQPPGEYTGLVTVKVGNAPDQQFPLRVKVWDFALPKASALRTCFRLIPTYLWKYANLPPAPGVPIGWEYSVWSGADVQGRQNYFGTGVFHSRFETAQPHSGRRALCIRGEVAEPGAVEVPRACYHRLFPVKPNTSYIVSVWYRTEGVKDGQAQVHVHTHGAHLALPAAPQWSEAKLSFTNGDQTEARLYLCNYGVGDVYFDDLSLTPTTDPTANVVADPSFESGGDPSDRERLLRAYRLNSLQHRCSDMNIATPHIEVGESGTVHIDWTEFDRDIEYYLEHGLNAFNVHWAQVPGGWGKVGDIDEKALQVSAEILRQTQEHLQTRGWLDLAYIYTIDEPSKSAFPDVKSAFDHVHRAAPKLKRLLTLGYGASRPLRPGNPLYKRLDGYVDIWVPHSDCFESEFLSAKRRAGDEIWEYVCISAQKPYANIWGIDFPGTDPRVVFWQCYAAHITGFLYWATNYWEKDPWQDPLTYPGGNGDGSLLYYGEEGPINSLRWETIRDSIEDYDYLMILQGLARQAQDQGKAHELQKQAQAALDVTPVTRSFTNYTTSPHIIEQHRAQVAQIIERLTSKLAESERTPPD